MSSAPLPNSREALEIPSRWRVAQEESGSAAKTALRELAESYWYCVYAWWRRAGLDAGRGATATLASFARWLGDAPPRAADSGGARLREWLPTRLGELSSAGVKLKGAPPITIDPEWAEARYATEPEGDADALFQRRWTLTVLEFTVSSLQAEYAARGEEQLFGELLPFAGFEHADEERYSVAAVRTGRTSGAMRKTVFDFRTRQREVLRTFVADTVANPADIESEITALLVACDALGPEAATAPVPSVLGAVLPDQMLARAMASMKMSSVGAHGWTPPSDAEIARLFPQYEMHGMLGRGGMGAVYQARQIQLDRHVAIKLLPLEVSVDRDFADRFRREARAMAKLNHPNIIAVHDFGTTGEGHLYFSMEFVEGANLHDVIHHGEPLPPADALALAGQVCDALAYAHEQSIVHRDIKPANVMVDRRGRAKVADFGLARMAEADPAQWGSTMTGVVMGTLDYMSPEQKRGMHVDHRADIYSLGVMLYEMLCRETPQGAFEPPSKRCGLDKRLDAIITKALAQQADARFQSTSELKTAIETVRPAVVKAQARKSSPKPVVGAAAPARSPIAGALVAKSRAPLYIGIAVAFVAVVAAFLSFGRSKPKPGQTAKAREADKPQVVVDTASPRSVPVPAKGPPVAATSASDEAGPTGSLKQTVNLISALDLTRDRVASPNLTKANQWRQVDGKLTYLPDGGSGKIMTPVSLAGVREYSIEADFRPLGYPSEFTIDLPLSSSKQCGLVFHPGVTIYFAGVKVEKIGDWPLGGDRSGRLLVLVKLAPNGRDGSVTVWLDGKPIGRWAGALAEISIPVDQHPAFSGQQIPGLFCSRESWEFTNWTLRVFDGEAKVLGGPGAQPAQPAPVAAAPVGLRTIFDGKTFAGWHGFGESGVPTGFRVEGGALIGEGQRKLLVTDELFGDFELSLEWRVGSGGNGGIYSLIGGSESGANVTDFPEFNLMDDSIGPKNRTGSLYDVQETTAAAAKPVGEWNTAKLIHRRGTAEHWVNNQLACAYDLKTTRFREKAGNKGRVGLQGWTGEIAYRNVQVRTLDAAATVPAAPAPAPAPSAAQSATGKWLAEQEPQWQAAFAKEVSEPFQKSVGDLKKQYLAGLDVQLAMATKAGKLDEAVGFRAEREKMAGGGELPVEDEALATATLRTLRASYRTAFTKIDADRFARAKSVHARYDAILGQSQTALTQRQRFDEALEIKARREALSAAWLKPPAGAAAAAPAAPAAPATPPPALGQKTAPPPSKAPKLKPREVVERLLGMGASVFIGAPGALTPVEKLSDLPGGKFAIMEVRFRPADALTTADLDIVEQLTEAELIAFSGVPATDATMEKLRGLPAVKVLEMRDLPQVSDASCTSIAAMPALTNLLLGGTLQGASLASLNKARNLGWLSIHQQSFTETQFTSIAGISNLWHLGLMTAEPVPPAAWGRLAQAKHLRRLALEYVQIDAAGIAQIAKLNGLEAINFGSLTLPDAALAPLGALKSLRSLGIGARSTLDGSVFATWPVRTSMERLEWYSVESLTDDSIKAITAAFPKLKALYATVHAGKVTPAGLAHLNKLRQLEILYLAGNALDDAALAQIAQCDKLKQIYVMRGTATDVGVQSLSKLSHLEELSWSNPPVTDAALKSYGKMRALTKFTLSQDTSPETEQKLKAALPKVTVKFEK